MPPSPSTASPTPPRLRLRVTAAAERAIRGGHPWVFADSVREQNREGDAGELAVIFDRQDKFFAIGLFDPESPLRVRVLHFGKPATLDAAWWREHFRATVARRDGLFDARTNGYRCISGESDGWPGLVLDRYADTFVMKLYTAAWLPRWRDIAALVRGQWPGSQLIVRLSRNIQALAGPDFSVFDGMRITDAGNIPPAAEPRPEDIVVFSETGLRFEADVVRGQKTGFFLDQRENRRRVETFAKGAAVLNAFSFSGGFSLYAARGGATSVTDLDISPHALESARRNFALNLGDPHIARCRHETVQADAFPWLERAAPDQFDLVVLDPPSLARRETERAGAIQAYDKLAAQGLRLLRPRGVLVAASCSAHVTMDEFFEAVRDAVRRSGRRCEELLTVGHPPDHPATFAEAHYLKAIYLRCF